MTIKIAATLVSGAIVAFAAPAMAVPIYLDFENIAPYPNVSDVVIGDYYNGGTSSAGTSGTNFGVQFTSQATLLCLNTAASLGCSNTSRGGLGIPGSQLGALYFPSANPTMNVAAGFDTGFSFVYSDPTAVGTMLNIFSGLNGGGSLLASVTLPGTGFRACDPSIAGTADYCPFNPFSVAFSGIAQSVVFSGQSNRQVFDDFTFGSVTVGGGGGTVTAAPEPGVWSMMIVGFGIAGSSMRYRRRNTRVTYA